VVRLPEPLRAAHETWQTEQLDTPAVEQMRRRCRRLALSLFELGEDVDATERQLARWRFHPAMARECAAWAWARHREALAAATLPPQAATLPPQSAERPLSGGTSADS
jgi:hypothetical protein